MGEAVAVAARRFGIDALKPEQEDAIKAFVGGRAMLVCMATGCGYIPSHCCRMYVYNHLPGLDTLQLLPSIVICKHGKNVGYSSS